MRVTTAPCKITGVGVGEVHINCLGNTTVQTIYGLYRDPEKSDGVHAGRYTKEGDYSPKTLTAVQALIDALEEDAQVELFEVKDTRIEDLELNTGLPSEKDEDETKDKLDFPTLGDGDKSKKGTPQF